LLAPDEFQKFFWVWVLNFPKKKSGFANLKPSEKIEETREGPAEPKNRRCV
jgi:hypothetical protein